jgi:RHH-type proline utilization regulon transcriptional repressor/proline dehydrogenase/delta 1-pyrroline-5-carboxylate dehydrogenase
VAPTNHQVSSHLVEHPQVDQVILTGAYETAELFRQIRPALPLFAETSGKNAIIVTPSADLNLAVKDVVYSAFAHAGQKCSACSLVVLVGSMGRSRRFRDQLIDAVSSLKVGRAWQSEVKMGPLVDQPSEKLQRGLTVLEPGQNWVVKPTRLDDTDTLWSPGVRAGVAPGSEFHMVEYFGPVLGVMLADNLAEAVELVNAVDYGLTSGLHSLDRSEISYWLEHIQAGNLYVNRTITGAIVQRQPFGGWKKSAVGPGAKAGGPNYLFGLTNWVPAKPTAQLPKAHLSATVENLLAALTQEFGTSAGEGLRRAALSDAAALAGELASADVTGLSAEHNVLRYVKPVQPVQVRLAEGAAIADLGRVLLAGLSTSANLVVSAPAALPKALAAVLADYGVPQRTETDQAFAARLEQTAGCRVRLIGGSGGALLEAINGRPDVAIWDGPATPAGRLEVLPFLQEQSVTITAHRFGTPDPMTTGLL